MLDFRLFHLKIRDLGYILYRNIFLFLNGIIFSIVVLLYVFGDHEAALFLGIVFILNLVFGLVQDINAWLALEKLQLLTAPYVARLKEDGTSERVLSESIIKGEKLKLKIGDQVPCDSLVIESNSLEVNEGLITGESNSLAKSRGSEILAGSIITAGSGIVQAETIYSESRISQMTMGIKKHTFNNLSPIQKEVTKIVKYSGYILLLVIVFITIKGMLVNESSIRIVKNIGAMASLIVPGGLVFAMTLFFAYGAAHLFNRKVLLQEVSATEKLGRIKNLCMDKTGTITENFLTVEEMFVPEGVHKQLAKKLTAAYMLGTSDSSQIFVAINKFIKTKYKGVIVNALSFSSWRQFGAVGIKEKNKDVIVLAGSSDIFLSHLKTAKERKWLEELVNDNSKQGKHLLCIACLKGKKIPQNLSGASISLVTVFIFQNNLRRGIRKAINFFQNRGVHIRIISGDHAETVAAIAKQAGIKNVNKLITGKEMDGWSELDYFNKTKDYSIFSRIMPEQKEKIIDSLKNDGFTAMVGDGANDALAIKKADLGIAMFEGAPATRKLASVVLMNNSFADLPGGVELADTIITNLEIFASYFLNVSFVGLFFFLIISSLEFDFSLTPLNVTIIDYFTIGIPGLLIGFWSIRPSGKARPAKEKPFLKKILPFTILSAIFEAVSMAVIYWLSPSYLRISQSNILVLVEFIIVGSVFCLYALIYFGGKVVRKQKMQILFLAVFESILFFIIFLVPLSARFFDLVGPDLATINIIEILSVAGVFICIQHFITNKFILRNSI